jgi:hypothetical protein
MAAAFHVAPSSLLKLSDPYEAYCLDEAVCDYIARLSAGQKLRPLKTNDNQALIEAMEGGETRGGRRIGRRQP